MASDDAALVQRLVAGDAAALEAAYRMHAPRCNAVAYRILQDFAAAQDAVQEAFLSLWRHREGLVVRSAGVGPWLIVVTRNAALASLRSSRARVAREDRTTALDATVPSDPTHAVEQRDDAATVRRAIGQLPQDVRTVIELAYFRYLTMAQIAQTTETPLSTVKDRAQSGLRRLAQLLVHERTS